MTIDLGFIAKGPGLMGRPIVRDIRRLREELRVADERPIIELVYVIPGRLGGADFDGFELARSQAANRHHVVFIEVPPELAKSTAPMASLLELGRQAIAYARATIATSKGRSLDFEALLKLLDDVQRRLTPTMRDSSISSTEPTSSAPPPRRRPSPEEPSIEVILAVADSSAIDAAFDTEEALHEGLKRSGVGYVDGNEVGQGEFTIFVYGPDLASLRRSTESVVRERWTRPGARLRLSDSQGDEVETVTL